MFGITEKYGWGCDLKSIWITAELSIINISRHVGITIWDLNQNELLNTKEFIIGNLLEFEFIGPKGVYMCKVEDLLAPFGERYFFSTFEIQ